MKQVAGGFRCQNPATRHYLCAHPSKDGAAAPVEINRTTPDEWETFRLEPLELDVVPSTARSIAESWAGNEFPASPIAAFVAALADPYSALARVVSSQPYSSFPLEQLDYLSSLIVKSDRALQDIAKLFPSDPWAKIALPRLAAWLNRRAAGETSSPRFERVTQETNPVARDPSDPRIATIPYALNALARRKVQPRKDVCIVATVRNEGIYLLEWVAWHRSIGIRDIFIYSNNNTDGSDALLAAMANAGLITWLENSDLGDALAQYKAYGHALSILPDTLNYKWTAIIDADEFIMMDFDKFGSVSEYLNWNELTSADAIALNWIFFGTNGNKMWLNDLTIRRFRATEQFPNHHIKTIFRTNKFIYSLCHYPKSFNDSKCSFVNDLRNPHTFNISGDMALSDVQVAKNAWINHYYVKSAEEFIWKKARGYGDRRNDYDTPFASAQLQRGGLAGSFRYSLQFVREENYTQDARALARAPQVEREISRC